MLCFHIYLSHSMMIVRAMLGGLSPHLYFSISQYIFWMLIFLGPVCTQGNNGIMAFKAVYCRCLFHYSAAQSVTSNIASMY